ncbi:MAG: ABC transporter permease [Desulfomonile tiedjei]|uniref:ABC transporter permease n=1 Tax=Desulfomonile tiedjei TaxID=2358 RepID=A0A9D6V683_9BACT|nr:ABC transporter permease [Desulfomonile tiedjei]
MRLDDLLSTSWRMVKRHQSRYRTVMIAIVLGTVGFIMIRTLADSVRSKVSENLELIGGASVLSTLWEDRRTPWHLGEYLSRDAERLRKLPHVMLVAPIRFTERNLKASQGHEATEARELQMTCVDENYWETISPHLHRGRLIDASDVAKRSAVCVLHEELVPEIFGITDPLGKTVYVGSYTYTVIGILGGPANTEICRSVFIPLSLAARHIGHLRQFTSMQVRVESLEKVKSVRSQLEAVLKASHPGYEDGIKVRYHASRLERVNLIMFLVTMFSYAALATVFILGKVGLTNVMLSAVQERTREVGLRKALGATDSTIRSQFAVECVLVSLISGSLGGFLGILVSLALKQLFGLEMSVYVLSVSVLLDLCITTAIGFLAGSYPSRVASRLDIVTAMRFD